MVYWLLHIVASVQFTVGLLLVNNNILFSLRVHINGLMHTALILLGM